MFQRRLFFLSKIPIKLCWNDIVAIFHTSSFFDIKTQVQIIYACCILDKYTRDEQSDRDDAFLNEVDVDLNSWAT